MPTGRGQRRRAGVWREGPPLPAAQRAGAAPLGPGSAGFGDARPVKGFPAASPGAAPLPGPFWELTWTPLCFQNLPFPSRPSLRFGHRCIPGSATRQLRTAPQLGRAGPTGTPGRLALSRQQRGWREASSCLSLFCFPFHQRLFALICLHKNNRRPEPASRDASRRANNRPGMVLPCGAAPGRGSPT